MPTKTIRQSLEGSYRFRPCVGDYGIEIETETKKPWDMGPLNHWKIVPDGSLRNYGREFVIKGVVSYGKELDTALEEFREATKDLKFIPPSDTVSTSVHVHRNILNSTWKTLGNFLTFYTMFENLLIRYSGPDRVSNLFCRTIKDAEQTFRNIQNVFRNVERKNYGGLNFSEQTVKYAALNLSPIVKFGSVELRSLEGDYRVERIKEWIDIIQAMWVMSEDKELTPPKILQLLKNNNTLNKNNISQLLKNVFGPKLYKKLTQIDEVKLVEDNLSYAVGIAFCVKDWNSLDSDIKVSVSKQDLIRYAFEIYGKKLEDLTPGQSKNIHSMVKAKLEQKEISKIRKVSVSGNKRENYAIPVRLRNNIQFGGNNPHNAVLQAAAIAQQGHNHFVVDEIDEFIEDEIEDEDDV